MHSANDWYYYRSFISNISKRLAQSDQLDLRSDDVQAMMASSRIVDFDAFTKFDAPILNSYEPSCRGGPFAGGP